MTACAKTQLLLEQELGDFILAGLMNITALLNSWQRKPTNREGGERFETKKLQDGRRK